MLQFLLELINIYYFSSFFLVDFTLNSAIIKVEVFYELGIIIDWYIFIKSSTIIY